MTDIASNPTPPVATTTATTEFEKHVTIFDPSMSVDTIQTAINTIYNDQVDDEMGCNRYSFLFKPGTYGSPTEPLMIQLGYYMEVAGLGANPDDVQIYGKIEVYNRLFQKIPYDDKKLFIPYKPGDSGDYVGFALNNFWRSLSNVAINVVSLNQDQCRSTALFWAVSQASSMRRVDIIGSDLSFMDYCSQPALASGGFIADSRASKIVSGSQQQFFTRNCNVALWEGGVWNQVFVGVNGAPDESTFPDPTKIPDPPVSPFTTISTTPLSREKPYLYFVNKGIDNNVTSGYFVRVPSATTESIGITWDNQKLTPGRSLPLEDFLIATPLTKVDEINQALSVQRHVLFTPGVYKIGSTIKVENKDTVLLGLGQATLTAINGVIPLHIADQPGIVVAGLTLDAGEQLSDALLQVGARGPSISRSSEPANPTTLSDVYFRVGGPHIGKADICLEINSDNVLVDHTWVWRADHGDEKFNPNDGVDGDNERWRTNIGRNGVVVNGNNVTITGLFVEHYQEHNVVWNGNNGRVYFFQNELPYDPPSQQDWTKPDGTLGWAAYKVAANVTEHEFFGGGVYSNFRNCPSSSIVTTNGFEVPNRQGVKFHKTCIVHLDGNGTTLHAINGVGDQVDVSNKGTPKYVVNYPTSG